MKAQRIDHILGHFEITEEGIKEDQHINILKNCELMREKAGIDYLTRGFEGDGEKKDKKVRIIIDYDPNFPQIVARITEG